LTTAQQLAVHAAGTHARPNCSTRSGGLDEALRSIAPRDAHRVVPMVDDGPGAKLRWMLVTDDAHGLYAQFGFTAPDHRTMVRPSPRAAAP
jgi:hypothetical protein